MRFVDKDGNVIMYDEQGFPVTVLTVKCGVMFKMSQTITRITTVTVDPGVHELQDVWLFFQEKTVPMSCVQTRDVVPALKNVYYQFLTKTDDYSMDDFISRIVVDYFVKVLQYKIKPGILPDELLS